MLNVKMPTKAKDDFEAYLRDDKDALDENALKMFAEWESNPSIMKMYMEKGAVPIHCYNYRNVTLSFTFSEMKGDGPASLTRKSRKSRK